MWETLKPYFLPLNHPIRSKLDELFSLFRVTKNKKSLKKAGFRNTAKRTWSCQIISTVENFDGYWFKLFTDDEPKVSDWKNCLSRASGAAFVRQAIERNGFQNYFEVPNKWIYPLPRNSKSPSSTKKNFILIAEDMKIVSGQENRKKWQTHVTPEFLDAFYIILQEEGLTDSLHLPNIPFTKSGKIAFVDLEYNRRWPVNFHNASRNLNPEMRRYWKMLIENGGP